MNRKSKFLLVTFALSMLFVLIFSLPVSANSAEPPSLVIIVNNPTEDLSITLVSGETQTQAKFSRTAWEGYYVFYSRDLKTNGEYTFQVTTNGETFECTLNQTILSYNDVFTLDLSAHKITPGEYPFRSVLLISIRLSLTLLLEGFLFWLFRFRQKRSWIIFLAVNLVTQGALNIWLNGEAAWMPSYLFLGLIFMEFFVFLTEMIVLPVLIREHKKAYIVLYAFLANLISLIAGGYIITALPV